MRGILIRIVKSVLLKRRIKRHKRQLNKCCIYGKEFCTSPTYPNSEAQLLNIKINNQTGHKSKIRFGDFCNVSTKIFLNTRGSIEIGNYVYMNGVHMRIDHHLKIGSHCMFGPGIKLWDTKNHPLSAAKRHQQCEYIAHYGFIDSYHAGGGDINIENDVWIGMDVTILSGVTIGKGSVIAANSVVTKSIPENVLAGGVPAKVIKNLAETKTVK